MNTEEINKKEFSEVNIRSLYILPTVKDAGWYPLMQSRREATLPQGLVIVRGDISAHKKNKKKFADYMLSWSPGMPVAIVEAKDNKHSVSDRLQFVSLKIVKMSRWLKF